MPHVDILGQQFSSPFGSLAAMNQRAAAERHRTAAQRGHGGDHRGHRYPPDVPVKLTMLDNHRLRAEVCVRGKCYTATADLAPLLAQIRDEVAAWHAELHTTPEQSMQAVADMTEDLVTTAGEMLIGNALLGADLLGVDLVGFGFDDIGDAIGDAASAVGDSYNAVAQTVKDHAGDIKAAAGVAAAAAAASLPGGSLLAGPAKELAGQAIDAALGSASAKAAVSKAAAQNPHLAQLSHTIAGQKIAQAHVLAPQLKQAMAKEQSKKVAIATAAGIGGIALLAALL